MKIDFNAPFQQVSRLINAPAGARPSSASKNEFGTLLASISPDHVQAPEIQDKNGRQSELKSDNDLLGGGTPMASFRFDPPKATTPDLDKLPPKTEEHGVENLTRDGVKGPAVLKVDRVPLPHGLAELKKIDRIAEVRKMVEQLGNHEGVDPLLSLAVISKESGFDPNAVSRDGFSSKGLFQLLDDTGQRLFAQSGKSGKYDPFDPATNLQLGVNYLRHLHEIFSSRTDLANDQSTVPAANSSSLEKLAVAAFNAGEGRVAAAQQRATKAGLEASLYENVEAYLPQSTQDYVKKVIAERDALEKPSIG